MELTEQQMEARALAIGQLVGVTREDVMTALGDGIKRPQACEMENRVRMRKSVTAMVDIPMGTTITEAMVANRRPCPVGALEPVMLEAVIGQRAARDIAPYESIFPDMVTRAED